MAVPTARITDPVLRTHYAAAKRASDKYGIPIAILLGILKVEGGTNAQGQPVAPGDGLGPPSYGQFTTATGKALGVKYGDSNSEVDAIARYLIQLGWDGHGKNIKKAVASYNGGPANPQYGYADKVWTAAEQYNKELKGDPSFLQKLADATNPLNAAGDAIDDAKGVAGAAGGVVDGAQAVSKFIGTLSSAIFDAHWWLRIGLIIGGLAAIAIGVVFIGRQFATSTVSRAVSSALPTK